MLKEDTDKKNQNLIYVIQQVFVQLSYIPQILPHLFHFLDILLETDIVLHSSELFNSLFWYRLWYKIYFSSFTY